MHKKAHFYRHIACGSIAKNKGSQKYKNLRGNYHTLFHFPFLFGIFFAFCNVFFGSGLFFSEENTILSGMIRYYFYFIYKIFILL